MIKVCFFGESLMRSILIELLIMQVLELLIIQCSLTVQCSHKKIILMWHNHINIFFYMVCVQNSNDLKTEIISSVEVTLLY